MRHRLLATLLATLGMFGATQAPPPPQRKLDRPLTQEDRHAMDKAQAKRDRKAAKRQRCPT